MNILTVKELSQRVNVKEKTLYSLVRQGKIPHYRIGKIIRFNQDEIDQWMESKRAKPVDNSVDNIIRSAYNPRIGRPGHLDKEVIDCYIKEARSGG